MPVHAVWMVVVDGVGVIGERVVRGWCGREGCWGVVVVMLVAATMAVMMVGCTFGTPSTQLFFENDCGAPIKVTDKVYSADVLDRLPETAPGDQHGTPVWDEKVVTDEYGVSWADEPESAKAIVIPAEAWVEREDDPDWFDVTLSGDWCPDPTPANPGSPDAGE